MVGGLTVDAWVNLWAGCHRQGAKQWAWPDGESLLAQPNVAVRVFALITERINAEANKQ